LNEIAANGKRISDLQVKYSTQLVQVQISQQNVTNATVIATTQMNLYIVLLEKNQNVEEIAKKLATAESELATAESKLATAESELATIKSEIERLESENKSYHETLDQLNEQDEESEYKGLREREKGRERERERERERGECGLCYFCCVF
jgi:septal ring factor EnvC (AmiA/AmiB activator)